MGKPDIHTYLDVGVLYTRVGSVEGSADERHLRPHRRRYARRTSQRHSSTSLSVRGFQGAGIASVSQGDVRGAQLSGIANVAGGDVLGVQGAPVNVANDVTGMQVGVVNVGGKVRGLQLGVVNVADDVDGAAIGVVSVSKTGHTSAVAWASRRPTPTWASSSPRSTSTQSSTAPTTMSRGGLRRVRFRAGRSRPRRRPLFRRARLDRLQPGASPHRADATRTKSRSADPQIPLQAAIAAGYHFTPCIRRLRRVGANLRLPEQLRRVPQAPMRPSHRIQVTPLEHG